MGQQARRRFRPGLGSLEVRQVLTASVVHAAIVPASVLIATYNNTFTQIGNAFYAYEGPADDVLNALGSVASTIVSTVTSNSVDTSPSNDGSYIQDSKGDPNALQGRLESALKPLVGLAEADSLLNRTFAYGGLNTNDAPYFQSKLTAIVKQFVTKQVHRGEMVLVWPGQAHPGRHS